MSFAERYRNRKRINRKKDKFIGYDLLEPKVASRTIAAMKLRKPDMKLIQRLGK
jgi:hypothetical protein